LDQGAISVGFATKESLDGGPPTTDMTYVMPEAETVICFAIPLDKEKIRAYLRKDMPRGKMDHVIDNGDGYLKTFIVAKAGANFLEKKGFKSAPVISNFKYREEDPSWRTKISPPLALRLIAARSGVGVFGWSGNILVKDFGAPVLLGALVTSVKLTPSDPISPEESPCDKCKLCVQSCAFRMFDREKEDSYTLGGEKLTFSKRNDIVRCYIVCGGMTGLDKSKKWSTWSPGRTKFPETQQDVNRTFAHIFSHPIENMRIKGEEGSYGESKLKDGENVQEFVNSSENTRTTFTDNFILTCGNCQLICWGNHEETAENYKLLINSGCVIENEQGENVILPPEEANKVEQAVKSLNREEKTSDRRQGLEKYIFELFERLRQEQKS
jgi:epoxyqueuosine reductase QueG